MTAGVGARRTGAFVLLAAAALAVAYVGALLTGSDPGAVTVGVESFSSSSSALLDRIAALLPLGFAFGAGMVSAANPCGFAMLPAFLALFLNDAGTQRASSAARLRRALLVGGSVTVGFVVLFGVVGVAIAAGARSLAGSFPWLGLATGVGLVVAGGWVAVGGSMYSPFAERLSTPLTARLSSGGVSGYLAFGLAYGIASLSCTLPVFLAVLGSTLTLAQLPAIIGQLVLYGLGMGLVITLLALSIAVFQGALVDRIRKALPYLAPAGAVMLLLAGTYIVYYWLTAGGLLAA